MATIEIFNEICRRDPKAAIEYATISREPRVLWAADKLKCGEWRIDGKIVPAPQVLRTERSATPPTLHLLKPAQPKPDNSKKRSEADAKRAARRERDKERHKKTNGLSSAGKQSGPAARKKS